MPKIKARYQIFAMEEPEESIETCHYCGTKYDKKAKRGKETGNCPNCGGTVTEETGYPKSEIGRICDFYVSKSFNISKITNEKELIPLLMEALPSVRTDEEETIATLMDALPHKRKF
jgi:hypothetical protein